MEEGRLTGTYMDESVWKPTVNAGCLPPWLPTLILEAGALTEPGAYQSQLSRYSCLASLKDHTIPASAELRL